MHTTNGSQPLFALGSVYATPGALAALASRSLEPAAFLARHVTGDWGVLDENDTTENQFALEHGTRILSSYPLDDGENLWIITEADRSSTTLLLPDEY